MHFAPITPPAVIYKSERNRIAAPKHFFLASSKLQQEYWSTWKPPKAWKALGCVRRGAEEEEPPTHTTELTLSPCKWDGRSKTCQRAPSRKPCSVHTTGSLPYILFNDSKTSCHTENVTHTCSPCVCLPFVRLKTMYSKRHQLGQQQALL